MKIHRNDPCHCGSGKKFKKCCMDKTMNACTGISMNSCKKVNNSFFENFNTISLLQSFAGLSLLPENHGKYVRLEELAILSIQTYNNNNNIPSSQNLQEFLDAEYPSHHLEDPPVNLFTDLVTFYGGDYLIFPGITENGSFILKNILAAVFHWPDSGIPKQFVVNCTHTISLILAISNAIASRLSYKRYQEGTVRDEMIDVPNDDILNNLKASVTFTSDEIDQICKENSIAKAAIKEFLIDINSLDTITSFVEESPLVYKPILYANGYYIVVSPTTLSLAITEYIWVEAERTGCMKEVNDAFHSVLWNLLQMQLGQMKFRLIEIEGIVLNIDSNKREGLYRFDDDKIAYVQYLYDKGLNYKVKHPTERDAFKKLENNEDHKKTVITQIHAKPEFANYKIFDFIILSSIGRGFICPISKSDHAITLVVPLFELDVLWNLKETKALDLWKFAIAREEQLLSTKVISFSFLDQYRIFKDHDYSFYLSDENRYSFLHIEPGYSAELIRDSILATDKHSVLRNVNSQLASVQVELKDKYSPVYVELMGLANSELEFLVEGFHQPLWIKPQSDIKSVSGELKHIYWEINDAIAYWLWQIQDDIHDDLKSLGRNPLTAYFDFDVKEKFETIERNFTREENLIAKFQTFSKKDNFYIIIPSEIIPYLYGSDNEGERVMTKALLMAINKLLLEHKQPIISEERIAQIIHRKVPLGMKKKFFILDTQDNLLLDPKNIKGHRYVQDYDTSIVLNSIVPALGPLCPSVGEIETQKEKDDLSFKIVQNALLPILKAKISQYDSIELLKRLISQNESLIRKREELRILTPTRIACFVSVEQHQIDLLESLGNVNRTTIALRCLIEHIAAEPKKGTEIISITAVDELVAIMSQVISWGSLSDQIHFNLFDVKMRILASRRIGVEKTQIKDVFDPYYRVKTKENVANAISTFDQVFHQNENYQRKEMPKKFNNAFLNDYGISFSRILEFMESLVHIGFQQSNPYASMPLDNLRDEVNKYVDDFEEAEFQNAINYLALTNRGKIEKLPKGYEYIDIMPWRFNRMLSLNRKPIVLVDSETKGESKTVYWGVRQILVSRLYLAEQCQSDRLRVFEKSEVKKVLGKFAQQRGDALVKKIIDSINPEGLIVDKDVYIGPNHSLKNAIDIGDVDILIIDLNAKMLFSLECKSMSPSRNIKEMVEEVEKLFGSQSEMGWIDKHLRRHNWLNANRNQIFTKYNVDITDFIIKSIFITNVDMLTPHLKKQRLPIPFVSSYEIEKEGYEILMNI